MSDTNIPKEALPQSVAVATADEPRSTGSLIPMIALISLAAFGSYFLGYFHWSILWTSVFLAIAYNYMFRRLDRLRRYHRHALLRDVARAKLETHVETTEWLNFMTERLWTVLEPAIAVKATEKINLILQDARPSFIDSLEMTEFTLGSNAPVITSAQVHPRTQPDTIHLDAEISFIPSENEGLGRDNSAGTTGSTLAQWNSRIVLSARIGKGMVGMDVPVMIKEVSIFGKVRIQIELAPTTPFMSKIEFAFLEVPQIDFILKPLKSFDLMDLPGLSNWLSSTINETLSKRMVNPNLISIPLKKSYSDVRSIGVLKVTLYEVRGMKLSGGGMNEPFVRLQMSGKYKAVSRIIDPKTYSWNQVFYILVHTVKNPLVFVVSGSSSNVVVGSVTFPVSDIEIDAGASTNVWRTIVGHESSKIRGELHFGVEYYPAEETPDPEADLDFSSGIAQISLHQVKDVFEGVQQRTLNCCYEVYVHQSNIKFDWKEPPKVPIGKHYRSKVKKRTNNPTWDDTFEVFLEKKEKTSITVLLRHGTKDDVVYACWTAPFTQLLNRTDWFTFDGLEQAQFYASFLYRPIRVDATDDTEAVAFSPCLGVIRLHVISGSGFKTGRGGYSVIVDVSGRMVGKTRYSLVEAAPVWNKNMVAIAKDGKDSITLDVRNVEKKTSIGHITCSISELLNHQGYDIEKHEQITDKEGRPLPAKLRFTVGIYVPLRDAQQQHRHQQQQQQEGKKNDDEPYKIYYCEKGGPRSNCGILEIQSVELKGVEATTVRSMHYIQMAFENSDPFYCTSPAYLGVEGIHTWNRNTETIIQEPDQQSIHFTVMEVQGGKDTFVDDVTIPFDQLHSNEWHQLGGMTQGSIKLKAIYDPLPLILEPEVEERGVLYIQILDARELIAVDSGGTSDPFCVLRLNGTKFFKSRVIKKCLTPVYNESTEVEIKQRDVSTIQIELRDWNKVAASRTLGLVNVDLQNLPADQWVELTLPLENVSSGVLHFKLNFVPLQDGNRRPSKDNLNSNVIAVSEQHPIAAAIQPPIMEEEDQVKEASVPLIMPESGTDSPPPSSRQSVVQRQSALGITLGNAAGVRLTIEQLDLGPPPPTNPMELKVKVRSDNRTIFKTRPVKALRHRWNESFTLDAEYLTSEDKHKLAIVLGGDLSAEVTLSPSSLNPEATEQTYIVEFEEAKAKLHIKYSLTMDTHNLVDPTTRRHRFSILGH